MRERINRLAKGIIDMETPALTIWPERMEEEIPADEVTRKDFFVTSGNGLHIKGLVYSSNLRVRALTGSFGGFRNRITYEIDGNKLEYGDQIEGSFYLVTNGGEKEIPYSFRVQNSASGKTHHHHTDTGQPKSTSGRTVKRRCGKGESQRRGSGKHTGSCEEEYGKCTEG